MVAFSVYKSGKYLFDCVAAADAAQAQPYPTVALDALEALRLDAVDVVKRMDYAEVDKLIACCRQHPPQTIMVPATHGDNTQFQDFAKYLKTRRRAGVVVLPNGHLLVLAPLESDDSRLRCVVVKARPSVEHSAAVPAKMSTIRVDEAAPTHVPQTGCGVDARPPPLTEDQSEKRRRGRVRPRTRPQMQEEEVGNEMHRGFPAEPNQSNQAMATPPAAKEDLVMLYSLPRLERATRIAQLRQEYEAFNEHYYDVLKEWSKADPDS